MSRLDLDVDSPEKVAQVLRRAAEEYEQSELELQSAWQDRSIKVWGKISKILERAATSIEKVV